MYIETKTTYQIGVVIHKIFYVIDHTQNPEDAKTMQDRAEFAAEIASELLGPSNAGNYEIQTAYNLLESREVNS